MIQTFAQEWLEEFWNNGKHKRVPPELKQRIMRKLDILNYASSLDDLGSSPGNKPHPLSGDRQGQHAISVNGPWRLCFRWKEGDVFEVELTQYH